MGEASFVKFRSWAEPILECQHVPRNDNNNNNKTLLKTLTSCLSVELLYVAVTRTPDDDTVTLRHRKLESLLAHMFASVWLLQHGPVKALHLLVYFLKVASLKETSGWGREGGVGGGAV